jgi:catechol 2,3-dioxygenase-like lactoylglutathione lyase family enzyme
MQRFHVNLAVKDITESVRFYSTLFDARPVVVKPDYAKWMLDEPGLNFSIATGSDALGIRHLGLQVDSAGELDTLRQRVMRSRGKVCDEGETTCCYANSDKSWVADDQGVVWEAFYTHGEAETFHGDKAKPVAEQEACCAPKCCEAAG